MGKLWSALVRAQAEGSRLGITYQGMRGEYTEHEITPLAFLTEDLFQAYCHTTGRKRTFRAFKITKWRTLSGSVAEAGEQPDYQPIPTSEDKNVTVTPKAQAMSIEDIITELIESGGRLYIEYRDYTGVVTEREITPLEWESDDKFRAYCHLRGAERSFRTFNIISFKRVSETPLQPPSPETPPIASQVVIDDYQAPKLTSRAKLSHTPTALPRQTLPAKSPGSRLYWVNTAEEWTRLVQYYADCVSREYRQQQVIERPAAQAHFFVAPSDQIHRFLAGAISLQFDAGTPAVPSPAARFINAVRASNTRQLCIGYPLLVLGRDRIAPLLLAPVQVEQQGNTLILTADDFEIGMAALDTFGLEQEERAALLAECDAVEPGAGQTLPGALEAHLARRLGELRGRPLDQPTWSGEGPVPMTPGQLYLGPCLFSVGSTHTTSNLIKELRELAQPSVWQQVPVGLQRFLKSPVNRDLTPPPKLSADMACYVTPVNDRQRQAVAAALADDITVVTGPPGTGKSQLVLNIIAQAIQQGETVLFASHNNKAVDVVMDRLQNEVGFRAAVRTGNRQNRRAAALHMAATLDQVVNFSREPKLAELRDRYAELRRELLETDTLLATRRELQHTKDQHQAELEDLREELKTSAKIAEANAPAYQAGEFERLSDLLERFLQAAVEVKQQQSQLRTDLDSLIQDNAHQLPVLDEILKVEQQWGAFGGGLLNPARFDTPEQFVKHIDVWLALLLALEERAAVQALTASYQSLSERAAAAWGALSDSQRSRAEAMVAATDLSRLQQAAADAGRLQAEAEALSNAHHPWWRRLLARLGLSNPTQVTARALVSLQSGLGTKWDVPDKVNLTDGALLARIAKNIQEAIGVAALELERRALEQALAEAELRWKAAAQALPNAVREDAEKVIAAEGATHSLRPHLEALRQAGLEAQEQHQALIERVNNCLGENSSSLRILTAFKNSPAAQEHKLWTLSADAGLGAIERHLHKWKSIVRLWVAVAGIKHAERELRRLPSEAELVAKSRELAQQVYAAGAQLTEACWLNRVRTLPNQTLDQTHRYVSAVRQQVAAEDGELEWHERRELKTAEATNLPAALNVFPVWATTNLSARSNLPLTPGLFDVVVIDEASQCDIPSALPLLYRAKRIVIIGDPKQLKHVAKLEKRSDHEAAETWGIDLASYSYNALSLYDLAQRCVGNRPGPILLNEHFRSDRRIITFSNEEFYGRQLIVNTDLRRLGYDDEFVQTCSGVFWLDVRGQAERAPGGSATNQAEAQVLYELLPWLLDQLGKRKLNRVSLGIVTPYKEQEKLLRKWLMETEYNGRRLDASVLAGTAHKFQGDEKDIILFSPVLGPGLSDGSLRWLETTPNLLNVALTRARVALIIVGNREFCLNLPRSHKYRRLADYVGQFPHRVAGSIAQLPLFQDEPFNIFGTILRRDDREYSRNTLRRLLRQCHEFLWWMDPYVTDELFSFLVDVCQSGDLKVSSLRILGSRRKLVSENGRPPELTAEAVHRACMILRSLGVNAEVGVLDTGKATHDRYLYSRNLAVNMPPVHYTLGLGTKVSEFTPTATGPELFEHYWELADLV